MITSFRLGVLVLLAQTLFGVPSYADVRVGDDAPLFDTLDQDLQGVSMTDLIDGRPLVLCGGSAS